MNLFNELKRRNVFRVGIAYGLGAWVLLQAADFGLQVIDAPNWILQVLVLIAAIGLPAVLVFAWVFEITPEGVKREKDIDRNQSITPETGKKLDRAIIGILVMAVALLLIDRFQSADPQIRPAEQGVAHTAPAVEPQVKDSARPDRMSLAVLPFTSMSTGEDDEYFADGLTEEILNSLAQLPELLVTARTSAFSFKGQDLPVQEIAQALGVAHIVEGSVRRSGDRLRITAQLIRATDGFHLWSENYDSREADTIAVQEDIAEKIAQALDVVLDDTKREAMQRVGLRDVEAFIAYQKALEWYGRAHGEVETVYGLTQANRYFDQVIERVPEFAPAYHDRSDLYVHALQAYAAGVELPGLDTIEQATAVDQAIESIWLAVEHARSPEERRSLGLDHAFVSGNWLGLSGRIETIAADTTCDSSNWLSPIAAVFGYAELLLQRMTLERKCDPLSSINWFAESRMLLWSGDLEGAQRIALEGLERAPGNWLRSAMYRAMVASREFEEATDFVNTQLQDPVQIRNARMLLASARGDRVQAEQIRNEYVAEGVDRAFWSLIYQAWSGAREEANRLAATVDKQPYGEQSLVLAAYWCACGAPWDLEATPNFKRRIEEAGLPWPPASPISFPLKEW
jgi:TolB-like protein